MSRFTLRVTEEMDSKLKAYAFFWGISENEAICRLLNERLDDASTYCIEIHQRYMREVAEIKEKIK